MSKMYDVAIVGGGPAGATMALFAEKAGLSVVLVDKASFPRDKICGDALSGKSVRYLRELGLINEVEKAPNAFINKILFSSPKNVSAEIKLVPNSENISEGYVCRREVFDNILFQHAKERVETRENFTVKDILTENGKVIGFTGIDKSGQEQQILAKVVVGADGYSSIIARKTGLFDNDPRHTLVATRAYYTGVTGLNTAIELHFVESVIPGYFWIFPLDNGYANVGIGMVIEELKKRKINLKKAHEDAVNSPEFKERFKDAKLHGNIVSWSLPVGSKRRKVHGDGFILIGDAAGLIDPFTGEGIGNAMASGKIAAESVAEIIRSGQPADATALNLYTTRLWEALGNELNTSYQLQRLGRIKPLLNFVIQKAHQKQQISQWISDMIAGNVSRNELLSPMTYIRLMLS